MSRPLIFISYRRSGDASGHAFRLNDALMRYFDAPSVFIDLSDIAPGREFGEELDAALTSCRVFLPVIGNNWLTLVDATGRRRLDDPEDWVHRELETALRRRITIIPLLVESARMPAGGMLPETLRALAGRQAYELSDSRWAYDVRRLITAIEKALGVPWWRRLIRRATRGPTSAGVRAVRALLITLAIGVVVLMWYGRTFPLLTRSAGLYVLAFSAGLVMAIIIDWALTWFRRTPESD